MLIKVILIFALISFKKAEIADKSKLKAYNRYLNFGDSAVKQNKSFPLKDSKGSKVKVDVLGEIFKSKIDALKLNRQLDLVFLIDSSSSVGEENFKSEIKFVKKLLSDVTVDYDHSRIAIVTFSSKNNVVKSVDEITDPNKENNKCLLLNKELQAIKYIGGGTYTLGAFQLAKKIFTNSRNDTKKVLFLITDGYSNGGNPVPLANELKQSNVTIFTIGIQNGNYKELYDLSTSPGEHYSYLLNSFQEFESLARRALHVDIKSGEYVPLGTERPCNILCKNESCCDKNAICTCGVSTGHYSCLCQPGYYGSGLQNSCIPCPFGTYADEPNLCRPCPNIHHLTTPPAVGINSCKCKTGYRPTKEFECETIKCKKLAPPEHGYFVKRQECGNVMNNACGVRCEVGYTLIGSSIRLCEINGNWSGSSPSCLVRTCSSLPAPLHGSISCSHADLSVTYNESEASYPVDTVCTFTCENGRVLTGSPQRTCLPVAQWDGLKTSCKQIKCNKLSEIPYGKIEPKTCTMRKQTFGTNCTYLCEDGFELAGSNVKSCTEKHGTWSNQNLLTTCEDVTPPSLVCPKNFAGNTIPGQNYGRAHWVPPQITDNSGLEVTTWLKPAIKNITNFKFKIGKTKVTYFAQDVFKNIAKCTFFVEITDNESPLFENCVDPVPFLSGEIGGANITWDEPVVLDNSKNFTVEKSHEFGLLGVGLTQVVYTARDSSNNTNVCVLNITVEESQCQPLPDPSFGNSNCSIIDNGIDCVITCQEGYAIPISNTLDSVDYDNSSRLTCSNSDPVWFSDENLYFPDCSITEVPSEISQNGILSLPTGNDSDFCSNASKLAEIDNEVKVSLQTACTLESVCNVNTSVICENSEDSEYEEKTNIIKREIRDQQIGKSKLLRINFEVSAKLVKGANLSSLENFQNLIRNENLSKFDIYLSEPNVLCAIGSAPKKFKCVQCPKGTFHNVIKNTCQSCDLGFYNDKVGQSSCIICPINHSTTRMHCKSIIECKAICPPGTHSRRKKLKPSRHHPDTTIDHTTLMPHCRSCSFGYYQPNYGQLSCRKCPEGYTTNTYRATRANQCVPITRHVCENQARVCNQGSCIIDNEFSYSCACNKNYIGTHCETRIDVCSSNPCLNNGICRPTSDSYVCDCLDEFYGPNCEHVQEPCNKKCFNNGTCLKNEDEEEECFCPDGFAGTFCEIHLQFCRENLCENQGKCVEQFYGFKCVCQNGFIGKRCNILPCDYKPCGRNFICTNLNKSSATKESFKCDCPKGYQGPTCSDRIDYCASIPCLNGGICSSSEEGFTCKCPKSFQGTFCQEKRNVKYILSFPKAGTTDFVQLDGFEDSLSELSVCLWMSTLDSFNYGTILSYATRDQDNAFTLTDYSGLVLYINGNSTITDILLNDGLWHFICLTWQSSSGSYKIYVDGTAVQSGTGLSAGTPIKGGGKFVIGQEQDVLGGKFSHSESFLGNITNLDVWSHVLNDSEVFYYMHSCSESIFGNVYAWGEIKENIHGDVKVLKSTFCVACAEPKFLFHGLVEIINNVAYYKCNSGYELSIAEYSSGRQCTKASTWEGHSDPECKKTFCGYPGYVMNANIIGNSYYYLDQVEYVCHKSYSLQGAAKRTCNETGTWLPEKPACLSVQCKSFKPPLHSEVDISSDLTIEEVLEFNLDLDVGTEVKITCVNETKLKGEDTLTCLQNGSWSAPFPECDLVKKQIFLDCPVEQLPQPPLNGYISADSLSTYRKGLSATVEVKCRLGYQLRGDNFTVCIVDGYWTEPNTFCDQITCGKPPSFSNMVVNDALSQNRTYYYGNLVNYECIDGYRMFGASGVRCLANGKWTNMIGKCTRKSCYKPNVRDATEIEGKSYLYLDQVTLICNKQRYTIICSSSGKWTGNFDDSC